MRKLLINKTSNMYLLLLVINIFFTGFIGIRPAATAFFKKIKLVNTLKEVHESLKDKQYTLNALKNDLDETKEHRATLNRVIPQDEKLDSYLVDIVKAAAKQGFELISLDKTEVVDQKTEITIIVIGDIQHIAKFIETLENLERLTTLDSIKINASQKDPNAVIRLEIYSLGKRS